jgi:hypothetical protein
MAYNVMGQPTSVKERRPGEGWAYADLAYAGEGLIVEASLQYQDGMSPIGIVKSMTGVSALKQTAVNLFA